MPDGSDPGLDVVLKILDVIGALELPLFVDGAIIDPLGRVGCPFAPVPLPMAPRVEPDASLRPLVILVCNGVPGALLGAVPTIPLGFIWLASDATPVDSSGSDPVTPMFVAVEKFLKGAEAERSAFLGYTKSEME